MGTMVSSEGLSGCGKSGALSYGKVVHARVIVPGVLADLPLLNSLVDMCSSFGDADAAMKVFQMIGSPDLVSWNSMIAGFSENGEGAMACFFGSRTGILNHRMANSSATGSLLSLEYEERLHAQVRKVGYGGSVYVGSTLVGMFLKNEVPGNARKLIDEMYHKDMVLFTELISGHSKHQEGECAMRYFNRMCEEGHYADGFALSSVVNAAADLEALKEGQMQHSLVVKPGYVVDMCVAGSSADVYAKSGEPALARV